ncbi:hypothetical protein [Mycolicibacterium phlei]
MLLGRQNQEDVERDDGRHRTPPPSPQPRWGTVAPDHGAFQRADDRQHGDVEDDQRPPPGRALAQPQLLQDDEDDVLAVGEHEQQQEDHREHSQVALMPLHDGGINDIQFG